MHKPHDDWGLGDLADFLSCGFGPGAFAFRMGRGRHRRGPRTQMFESGEVKFVILRLLKEKPRHGYEVIKALEEKLAGTYSASAGTVYPTLQLLEDQGYVRVIEENGKKVYHITPEGEQFLEANRTTIDDIFDRVRDTVRDFAGGAMGELHQAFARMASVTYKRAWRWGGSHPAVPRIIEILNRASDDIEKEWGKV
ncbi:MAG TPA: helix-turn-helix transcriptional regulator [Gemmatimonadales bacterium]|jgi:DNA-binding PadR family transcriptional regulator|nr:helix-turn-helix transcriptional regulator [Gemmatimonadales bacterium]